MSPSAVWRDLLRIEERGEGEVRQLRLIGELDLCTARIVERRLHELERQRVVTVLDLSQLEFVDCAGLGAILAGLERAEGTDWVLRIDDTMSEPVRRLTALLGTRALLRPGGASHQASEYRGDRL